MFSDYITNHKKVYNLYLVKYDFKTVFIRGFYSNSQSELQYIKIVFRLKKVLISCVEIFKEKGHQFSLFYQIIITAIS